MKGNTAFDIQNVDIIFSGLINIANQANQINKEIINMLVTKIAPDFTATTVMPDNSFKDITLSDFRGKKVVLFFYPLDFTFV